MADESETDKGQGHFKGIDTFQGTQKRLSCTDVSNLFLVSKCWHSRCKLKIKLLNCSYLKNVFIYKNLSRW